MKVFCRLRKSLDFFELSAQRCIWRPFVPHSLGFTVESCFLAWLGLVTTFLDNLLAVVIIVEVMHHFFLRLLMKFLTRLASFGATTIIFVLWSDFLHDDDPLGPLSLLLCLFLWPTFSLRLTCLFGLVSQASPIELPYFRTLWTWCTIESMKFLCSSILRFFLLILMSFLHKLIPRDSLKQTVSLPILPWLFLFLGNRVSHTLYFQMHQIIRRRVNLLFNLNLRKVNLIMIIKTFQDMLKILSITRHIQANSDNSN